MSIKNGAAFETWTRDPFLTMEVLYHWAKAAHIKSIAQDHKIWYNLFIMAKKSNTKRKLVGLVSEESGIRQYYTKKNTMNTPDKLSLRKYDPVLRKHVVFTETKKNLGRNEVKEKKR